MPPPLRCPSVASAAVCSRQTYRAAPSRCFSSTSHQEQRITRARQQLFRWLNTRGQVFLNPAPNSTNYLTSRGQQPSEASKDGDSSDSSKPGDGAERVEESLAPFPGNPVFVSQPILSEEMREEIWRRIMQDGQTVRDVSASLGVEMRRVGAVVRLKEIEKEWLRIGKPLARPYAKAVMSMLPRPPFRRDGQTSFFEPINELTLHAATSPQIFYPTSESRHFTRADAARVFDENLLPADDRVPHPQLALMYKDVLEGFTPDEVKARQQARDEVVEKRRQAVLLRKAKNEAATVKTVETQRWRFRFTDINVDDAGKTGRGEKGVGWRYGAPLMDRKKGVIKIPTKVG